jgi:peptidoglycan/xylan/chitin deacetylase (PgdA/CDA1 family)
MAEPSLAILPACAFLIACFTAAFFPGLGFFLPVVTRGPEGLKAVALSFDDGPHTDTTPLILGLLERYSVKAMFCVAGDAAEKYPWLIDDVLRAGHELCNHTMTHDTLLMFRRASTIEREIAECDRVIKSHGVAPLAFRPPVGVTGPALGPILEKLGLFCLAFSCRARDFGNRRIKNMSRRILSKVRDGDIILMHDASHPALDVKALLGEIEAVITGCATKGFKIVQVSALIGRPVMAPVGITSA